MQGASSDAGCTQRCRVQAVMQAKVTCEKLTHLNTGQPVLMVLYRSVKTAVVAIRSKRRRRIVTCMAT